MTTAVGVRALPYSRSGKILEQLARLSKRKDVLGIEI